MVLYNTGVGGSQNMFLYDAEGEGVRVHLITGFVVQIEAFSIFTFSNTQQLLKYFLNTLTLSTFKQYANEYCNLVFVLFVLFLKMFKVISFSEFIFIFSFPVILISQVFSFLRSSKFLVHLNFLGNFHFTKGYSSKKISRFLPEIFCQYQISSSDTV